MMVYKIESKSDYIVLHFDTSENCINAYTLASALVSLADAAKAANASLNIGHELEIVVDAIGPGSFRAKIKTIYSSVDNLFSEHKLAGGIIISLISSYMFNVAFQQKKDFEITINTNEVIIESNNEKIIVPRDVYDAQKKAEKNPGFVGAMSKVISTVASDEKISALGFVEEMDSEKPKVLIPKAVLEEIEIEIPDDPNVRDVKEECNLQIIKAILIKSKRKWEFMWRGITISAAILDDEFYESFANHDIKIAPRDTLTVTLEIKQTLQEDGIYENKSYKIVKVHKHTQGGEEFDLIY